MTNINVVEFARQILDMDAEIRELRVRVAKAEARNRDFDEFIADTIRSQDATMANWIKALAGEKP